MFKSSMQDQDAAVEATLQSTVSLQDIVTLICVCVCDADNGKRSASVMLEDFFRDNGERDEYFSDEIAAWFDV